MEALGHLGFFINDWWVSPPEGLLTRGDQVVHLEPKAMEVLVYFALRPGEVIMREELERDIWHGALVGYDAVTNTVIKLRKALQDNARQPRYIATIPKKGYQLIASISYAGGDDQTESASHATRGPPGIAKGIQASLTAHWIGMVIATLAGMLVVGSLWLWPVDSHNNAVLPSIVVLPFESLSDGPKQDYLADGITEDIITGLSKLTNMLVIASNTSFTYKGKQVSSEQVGRDLNVEFVLRGSIRRHGNEVRVNAQLVNTKTGFNSWAQRYDRKVTEVFAVQDEVTRSIVEALAIKMTNQEKQRLAQRATDNLKAYDFFQEGQKISTLRTKEAFEEARAVYRKAIELDPSYGRAYGAVAITLAFDYQRGWVDAPVETLDRALALAEKAVVLDDSTPQTYFALGFVHLMRKEYGNAEEAVKQALSIAPNYADGYGLLALINMHLGQPERAIEINTKGMRLNPYYSWQYLYTQGGAFYMLGDYDAAIASLEKAQERNPNTVQVKLFLTASYVKAGRQGDAEWEAEELVVLSPTATLSGIEKAIPIGDPGFKHALLKDLRKAGLPE